MSCDSAFSSFDQINPVINGVLLCLLQTASVVAVYCVAQANGPGNEPMTASVQLNEAWKALSEPCSHLLGFCTGALSAFSLRQLAEVQSSTMPLNIWTYAKDAIKVIRICFWISLRSAHARLRLTQGDSIATPSENWSLIVSVKDSDYVEKVHLRLRLFNELEQQRPLHEPVPLVVTAIALNQISIGGPPKQLARFKSYLIEHMGAKCRVLPLKIYSPYHTPALDHDVDLVMLDLQRRSLINDSPLPPSQKVLWETVNASVLREDSLRAALRVIIASNLSATADWVKVSEELVLHQADFGSAPLASMVIVSVGPGIGLAADLQTRLLRLRAETPSSNLVKVIDVPSLLSEHMSNLGHSIPKAVLLPQPDVDGEEIVVVSMACRFPGDVRTPEQLWTCLETGRSTVTEIPKHLFDIDAYYGDGINQTKARHMHALPEDVIKSMDARLFSMSPKEIEQLDPQHRLVMLCSYEALERAGYSAEANSPSAFDGKRIAVCMSASWDDYRENASWNIGSYFITGNIRAFIPGHVSFSLKWEGPSVSVDSLECSAVSAIQWSRRALLSGQCDVALTGAVTVLTQPQMFIAMDKEGILSRTGTNATFSSKLDGKTRGDGCGVLLLKRRSTALTDGDTILATLPAARTTYHGYSDDVEEAGALQSQFLTRVMSEAGVSASDIVHIEASGYHTQQGEATEFDSFKRLLDQAHVSHDTRPEDRISVASSRPNIGAGEAVSAMASVIKAVLMLERGSVPRQVSITHPSELQVKIAEACASSALFVPIQAQMLPSAQDRKGQRLILVNSLASTESHGVVLVGAPTSGGDAAMHHSASNIASTRTETAWIFVLSAKTKESADMMKKALINFLQREVNLADLSYSLACRRTHHPFRLSVVASDQDELIRRLRGADFVEAKARADLPPLGFVFQTPDPSSCQSLQACFVSTLGLRNRYEDLTVGLVSTNKAQSPDRDLRLMQLCVFALLTDCGVHPSAIEGDANAKLLAMLSEQCADVQEALSTISNSGGPDRHLWIKIDDIVSISAPSSAGQITQSPQSADPKELHTSLLATLGRLHQQGYTIRWIELFRPHLARLSFINTLPTYPFHLQQHWMEYHDRNLLPRVPLIQGSSPAVEKTVSEPVDTNDFEAPTQLLLTKQIGAQQSSRTYRADLAEEAELIFLETRSPCAMMVELMAESIREATESIEGTNLDCDLLLCDLGFRDAAEHWSRDRSITISVQCAKRLASETEGYVQFRAGDDTPRIGGCEFVLVERGSILKRWSILQGMVLDRIAAVKEEGELFSATFVYKTLLSDPDSRVKSIRAAYLSAQSSDAVFSMAVPPREPGSAHGISALPSITSGLEDCARWYAHSMDSQIDAGLGFLSVEELVLCNHWLEELDRASSTRPGYVVYISRSSREPVVSPHEFGINILVLNTDDEIVAELSRVRLGEVDRVPSKAASRQAPVSPPLAAAGTKAAPSENPTISAHDPAPRVAATQPVDSKAVPVASTGRAMDTFNKVLGVLAAELGIAVEEMKPGVKFADLGLDSLMSLVCISTLEALHLGFEIPQSLFLECDSPAELLQWIREQAGDDADGDDTQHQGAVPATAAEEAPASPHFPPMADVSPAQMSKDSKETHSNSAVEEAFKTIRTTIETELGVAEGSIDGEANLADLGMDSLMSLLVLGNLTGALPIELPSSLFMDCTSLREIHAFLAAELGEPSSNGATVSEAVTQPPPGKAVNIIVPPAKKPVLLRQGSDPSCSTPLFLLPDGSGMSTVYQNFHAIDRPVYSLNSPYLADATTWTGGIAPIAQHYLASMQLVQPIGPWLVGGWSFGGMVAFEIARLLATSNGPASDRVAGLFLLDSPCPILYPPLPMSIVDWIFTAPEVKDIAPPALSDKLVKHFKATVDSLVGWKPSPVELGDKNKIPKTWYIVANHPLPGKIADIKEVNETVKWLFRPNRAEKSGADGWQQLLPVGTIGVSPIAEANHFTLVREPAVGSVAQCLQEACRAALPL
uniref:Polyketide synthase n=1 Tax=Kalmanozyma brasiliensis (strain GHG001) TaxID=1365824 RepID=V5EPC7_KALBG